jgi:hypothetical protein
MTTERAVLVRLPVDRLGLRSLLEDIRAAKARAEKAMAGERIDVVRYEALSSQLEDAARRLLAGGGAQYISVPVVDREGHCFFDYESVGLLPAEAAGVRSWIEAGDVSIEIRAALQPGRTQPPSRTPAARLREPAKAWRAPLDSRGRQLTGTSAVAERFRQQLQAAVDSVPDAAMMPSGVSNRALTEGLRSFVTQEGPPLSVDVIYRDGSVGPRFPLRCLKFVETIPTGWRTFHFAMLSIRHTEMDVVVDGAWFRNTDISRPRPAGDTDRIAYELSCKQLSRLCKDGPALLYFYQTGLDAAVVGFYRAVVSQLLSEQRNLAVVPRYFCRQSATATAEGSVAGYRQQSTFAKGEPWVV